MAQTYACRALRCIPRAADGGAAGACGDRFAGRTYVAKCAVSADRNPRTVHYNSFVIQQDSAPGASCIQRCSAKLKFLSPELCSNNSPELNSTDREI